MYTPSPVCHARLRASLFVALAWLAGCSALDPFAPTRSPRPPQAIPPTAHSEAIVKLAAPLATHRFEFDPETDTVVGVLQLTTARHEDTLPDLARRFNLGFDELRRANPGVDPWLPGEGTRIVLPTQFVLPEAPYEGIVINVASLRLFYFPAPEPDAPRVVYTHPIGIGKVGWATPIGQTTIVSKRAQPWWTPPVSVRKEHAEAGDPLPARVPPGPDNPLGAFAMNLGWPSYLMHGTNKPAGVGLRASHGCIRLFPEDIASLFDKVSIGAPVRVVNQPLLYRWHGNSLYVQAWPALEEDAGDPEQAKQQMLNDILSDRMWQQARERGGSVDWTVTERVLQRADGIAVPVSRRGLTHEAFLDAARRVENVLPGGSNWDGDDAPPEGQAALQ